jgi:imidazolonepropionase-like amidohydrolase
VGTVCSKTTQARADGVATTAIPRAGQDAPVTGPRLIVGVAPDGARAVSVHTRGRVAVRRVVNGLFILRDHAVDPPDRISVRR